MEAKNSFAVSTGAVTVLMNQTVHDPTASANTPKTTAKVIHNVRRDFFGGPTGALQPGGGGGCPGPPYCWAKPGWTWGAGGTLGTAGSYGD